MRGRGQRRRSAVSPPTPAITTRTQNGWQQRARAHLAREQVVQAVDDVPLPHERVDEVGADEARAARDEDATLRVAGGEWARSRDCVQTREKPEHVRAGPRQARQLTPSPPPSSAAQPAAPEKCPRLIGLLSARASALARSACERETSHAGAGAGGGAAAAAAQPACPPIHTHTCLAGVFTAGYLRSSRGAADAAARRAIASTSATDSALGDCARKK